MLRLCPECEKSVSDSANECPHCGFRLNTPHDLLVLVGLWATIFGSVAALRPTPPATTVVNVDRSTHFAVVLEPDQIAKLKAIRFSPDAGQEVKAAADAARVSLVGYYSEPGYNTNRYNWNEPGAESEGDNVAKFLAARTKILAGLSDADRAYVLALEREIQKGTGPLSTSTTGTQGD
jgi:hypothetical protein